MSQEWLYAHDHSATTVPTVTDIRELTEEQTKLGAEALLALRPRWETVDAIVELVDTRLRPAGYRLIGAIDDQSESAASVLGFRESWTSAWGHFLYIDDLSTLPAARGRGHADLLLRWVEDEAQRLGCESIHLDSGVGPDRASAHRLYMRHHLRISAHHFEVEL